MMEGWMGNWWAVVASLPFAPEIVLPTVRNFQEAYPQASGEYCPLQLQIRHSSPRAIRARAGHRHSISGSIWALSC